MGSRVALTALLISLVPDWGAARAEVRPLPQAALTPARAPDAAVARHRRLRVGLLTSGSLLLAAGVGTVIYGGFYAVETDAAVRAKRADQQAREEACNRRMESFCSLITFNLLPGLDYAGPALVLAAGIIGTAGGIALLGAGASLGRTPEEGERPAPRPAPVQLTPTILPGGGGLLILGRF